MVAQPAYRGLATGIAYLWVKVPSFLSIFLFPLVFASIGHAGATLLVCLFPLAGLLAAIFLLPELYGRAED